MKDERALPPAPGADLPPQDVHLLQQYADALLQARLQCECQQDAQVWRWGSRRLGCSSS